MLDYLKYSLWFHVVCWCVIVVAATYVVLDQLGK